MTVLVEDEEVRWHRLVAGKFRLSEAGGDGVLRSVNTRTGKLLWSVHLGTLAASTPAVVGDTVFATVLEGGSGGFPGRIVALNYASGAIRRPVCSLIACTCPE